MPLRTPVGRYGGSLKDVDAETLASTVIKAVLDRTGIDPLAIEDCIMGQGYPSGESPAIGRTAVLRAGLPVEVPGTQIDRRCGCEPRSQNERTCVRHWTRRSRTRTRC